MKSHLKVKVCSLSAEMTIIRKQEQKWKDRARRAREKLKGVEYAEANFWSLRYHRAGLKFEARATHLAYGFMRCIPYSAMERICYGPLKGFGSTEPNWAKIEEMVDRFSKDEPDPQGTKQRFAEWLADAKLWYEDNPKRIKEMNAAKTPKAA